MDFIKQQLSFQEARELDMVDYMSALGHEPVKVRNSDYWYLSPVREERTASFKVSRSINRWYDHGLGKGGSLIDFAIHYYKCTAGEALEKHAYFPFISLKKNDIKVVSEAKSRIKITSDSALSSYSLLRYLEQRKIPIETAREVRYKLSGKAYYGIGFKNDFGGWEIRNHYFKTSSSPKGLTTFKNGSDEVLVFEGFMDFLSFKSIHSGLPENSPDFVVLNSLSFFEASLSFLEEHQSIKLYLDRDEAGQNYSRYVLSLSKKYRDEGSLYANHKDFNEWLVSSGNKQKKRLRLRLG